MIVKCSFLGKWHDEEDKKYTLGASENASRQVNHSWSLSEEPNP